jgi:hypothetical protein
MNERLELLAKDLTKDFPRRPRETLAGYVLAARAVDKCRSTLVGRGGDFHFDCPLDNIFLGFAGIKGDALKEVVATGADDAVIADWISKNATQRPRIEIIKWNNEWRGKRLCELPDGLQEFMEDYVPQFIPRNRPIVFFFDIFDIEEERI